jgi:hypothetical protein
MAGRRNIRVRLSGCCVALAVAGMMVAFATTPARAQFGLGYGGMWGFGVQSPEVVRAIDRRAEISAANAVTNRGRPHVAPSRAPRDVTFFERYNAGTRLGMNDPAARRPARPVATTPAPSSPASPVTFAATLDSFFNRYDDVVWPSDAPATDELLPMRRISDNASREALKEFRAQGLATVASSTEGRNALLAYGRPALQYLRDNRPSIAESFHGFLLGLYDALGRAATEPRARGPQPPPGN